MSTVCQRSCSAVLAALTFITFLVPLGGRAWSQAAPPADPGVISRDWRLVGVYVRETMRNLKKLPPKGYVKVKEANAKGGSADIEVLGPGGLLFRQKFSWKFLQDMSVIRTEQRCPVMFRIEGDRPKTNGNLVYLWSLGGASPSFWPQYFPSVKLTKPMENANTTVGRGNTVNIDFEGSSPNSSNVMDVWIRGDNSSNAIIPAFSSFWFGLQNFNGEVDGMENVEIHYLFAAEAKVPAGGAAVPPLTPPTTELPPGVTFLPPTSGPAPTPTPVPPTPTPKPPTPTPTPPIPPTGPGANPTPPPGEPPLTAQGQHCIQEWMNLVVRILNERQPDNAPWRFNQYGILENRTVTSAYSPDGWMTNYQGNRYLYVWQNYSREHQNAVYGGRLPALSTSVAECTGRGGPGAGPGGSTTTSGGTTSGTTTVIDPAPPERMTLQAGRLTMREGETLMMPISLLNASSVAAMNFTIRYDAAVAIAKDPTSKGNLLDRASFECNTSAAGTVQVGFAQTTDLSGTGTVAQIPFTATGAAGTRTALHLEVTTISNTQNQHPAIATIDGEILIVGPQGRLPGDSDGHGVLTARDYANALKMSVGLIPVDLICDMDKDGKVTSTDARLIASAILNAR